MPTYVITYDLNKESQRPPILQAIKKMDWTRLSESSYAVSTHMHCHDVHASLKQFLDDNDTIYILELRGPFSGFGPAETNDWLESHVPLR